MYKDIQLSIGDDNEVTVVLEIVKQREAHLVIVPTTCEHPLSKYGTIVWLEYFFINYSQVFQVFANIGNNEFRINKLSHILCTAVLVMIYDFGVFNLSIHTADARVRRSLMSL